MSATTTHTPTWFVRGFAPKHSNFDRFYYSLIQERNENGVEPIAKVEALSQKEAHARAAHIVRCVNEREGLLRVLNALLNASIVPADDGTWEIDPNVYERANAVLGAAEQEEAVK